MTARSRSTAGWAALASAGAAAVLALSGCGSSNEAGARTEASSGSAPAEAAAKTGPALKIVSSDFGRVLSDPKGEALYLFTKDGTGPSRCHGDCARAWPPYIVKRKPGAGAGVTAGLGTIERSDGRLQATSAGKPLYYYVSDSPGDIRCQDVEEFGGHWYVIKPSGKPVL